jgi:hypothetical protein
MRLLLVVLSLLAACGPSATPAPATTSTVAPTGVDRPSDDEAAASGEAAAPEAAAVPLPESCEALARPCGGWIDCIHVRRLPPDPAGATEPLVRFEGLGPSAGHYYSAFDQCIDGVCSEMCDPASGACRPGLIEDVPTACSRSTGPSRAPFFCELVAGACVRHDLPPPAVHAGGRS